MNAIVFKQDAFTPDSFPGNAAVWMELGDSKPWSILFVFIRFGRCLQTLGSHVSVQLSRVSHFWRFVCCSCRRSEVRSWKLRVGSARRPQLPPPADGVIGLRPQSIDKRRRRVCEEEAAPPG